MNATNGAGELTQSFDELVDELTRQLQAGESPDLEHEADRFPEYADRLRQLWPAMRMLADFGHSQGATGSFSLGRDANGGLTGELGDFRLIREIGRGGMGVVYEARQISLDRRVALKVLPFASMLDDRQLQRFKIEARAAAGLHHTNIVPVFSVGCERGVHYYAMQYIEGRTLAEVVCALRGQSSPLAPRVESESSPLSPEAGSELPGADPLDPTCIGGNAADAQSRPHAPRVENQPAPDPAALSTINSQLSTLNSLPRREYFRNVAQRGIQIAEALEYAHSLGVVHRDIKPSNLLLDARGTVWVADFGLAQIGANSDLTITGDIVGTLRYMSPEQAMGSRLLLDHRTDVYSLGITLYELLTLRPAFPSGDRQRILRQIAEDDPKPPRELNPAIPHDLETIILKATAKEPQSRYPTAQELADDLQRFLQDEPLRARRPTFFERASRWTRRHSTVVAALALVLLVVTVSLITSTVLVGRAYEAQSQALEREREQKLATDAERQRASDNYDRAREAVRQMLTRVANDELARIPEMKAVRRQLLQDAAAFYTELLKLNPDDPLAYSERAEVFRSLGEYAKVRADFEKAVTLKPDDPALHVSLARFIAECPDVVYRDYEAAVLHLQRAIRLAPQNPDGRELLARLYCWRMGRSVEAAEEMERAAELYGGDTAQAHWCRIHACLWTGDDDGALENAKRALQLQPENPWLHREVSGIHTRQGRQKQAAAAASRAIESVTRTRDESSEYGMFHFYNQRAGAYTTLKREAEALADYDKSIELAPFRSYTHKYRAAVHFRLRNFAAALADLTRAVELKPDELSAMTWIAPELAADCPDESFRRGFLDLADEAVRLNQNSSDARITRGAILVAFGDVERARTDLDAARLENAASFNTHYWAGLLAITLNDLERYREICRGMVRQFADTSDPDAARFTAWTAALIPDALDDYTVTIRLAREMANANEGQHQHLPALGAILMRAGRYTDALEPLRASLRASEHTSPAFGPYFLAMTEQHLGRTAEARKLLARADAAAEKELNDTAALPGWNRQLTLQLLRKEAETLIGATPPPAAETNDGAKAAPQLKNN